MPVLVAAHSWDMQGVAARQYADFSALPCCQPDKHTTTMHVTHAEQLAVLQNSTPASLLSQEQT